MYTKVSHQEDLKNVDKYSHTEMKIRRSYCQMEEAEVVITIIREMPFLYVRSKKRQNEETKKKK